MNVLKQAMRMKAESAARVNELRSGVGVLMGGDLGGDLDSAQKQPPPNDFKTGGASAGLLPDQIFKNSGKKILGQAPDQILKNEKNNFSKSKIKGHLKLVVSNLEPKQVSKRELRTRMRKKPDA